jgi:hypothetical protein
MARQHAALADFELVGMSEDPTPGDPELIQGILQRYSDIGDAAEQALNVLKKDGAVAAGQGSAMHALSQKIGDDLPAKLTKTATSYHDAAGAYRDYIPRLREAQDTFDRAVELARTAAPQANQPPPTLAPDATDDQKAAAKQTQDAIDAGRSQLSAAKSLAEQAQTIRQTAQRSCADVLDRAAGEAIPERNIFQKIIDFFHDFPFVQILLGLLIAIVSVFFPVVGFLLGAALLAITVVPEIATGQFNLGDLLIGLIGLIPGAALVKFARPLLKAGAAVASRLGSAVTKTVKGTITGIRSSLGAGRTIGPLTEGAAARSTDALLGDAGSDAESVASAGTRGGGRGTPEPERPAATPDAPKGPEFLPSGIKLKSQQPLVFTHQQFPQHELEFVRGDLSEPVFKVKSTGEQVFADVDDNTLRKFKLADGDIDFGAPKADVTKFTGDIPVDHFLVKHFEGRQDLPKLDTFEGLRTRPAGEGPVLVPTDKIPDSIVRTDLDPARIQSIKDAFAQHEALPAVDLARDLSISEGNHRIAAAKQLGLPFVPVQIHD